MDGFKRLKLQKGLEGVVWIAICWSIWIKINTLIFRSDQWNILDTIWSIMVIAWKWSFLVKLLIPNVILMSFIRIQ